MTKDAPGGKFGTNIEPPAGKRDDNGSLDSSIGSFTIENSFTMDTTISIEDINQQDPPGRPPTPIPPVPPLNVQRRQQQQQQQQEPEATIMPTQNDVLFGRGGHIPTQGGNILFSDTCRSFCPQYIVAQKNSNNKGKKAIINQVIQYFESENVRFLMETLNGEWVIATYEKKYHKVSQKIREFAKKLRDSTNDKDSNSAPAAQHDIDSDDETDGTNIDGFLFGSGKRSFSVSDVVDDIDDNAPPKRKNDHGAFVPSNSNDPYSCYENCDEMDTTNLDDVFDNLYQHDHDYKNMSPGVASLTESTHKIHPRNYNILISSGVVLQSNQIDSTDENSVDMYNSIGDHIEDMSITSEYALRNASIEDARDTHDQTLCGPMVLRGGVRQQQSLPFHLESSINEQFVAIDLSMKNYLREDSRNDSGTTIANSHHIENKSERKHGESSTVCDLETETNQHYNNRNTHVEETENTTPTISIFGCIKDIFVRSTRRTRAVLRTAARVFIR